MIITEFDSPLTAEEARQISLNNRDDSEDRDNFRTIMENIRREASYGRTRYTTAMSPKCRQWMPSEHVLNAIRSMGYSIVEKRAYEWDTEKRAYSTEKPHLDGFKRETFFLEITWG